MNGYRMPAYVEEILTQNYCGSFMRMSIVSDSGRYSFSYKPENFSRIDTSELSLYDKLLLIRNLISMSESSSDHLISAETYLLEPELVYAKGRNVDIGSLKIMFYPDVRRMRFPNKLMTFTERIKDGSSKEERELLSQFRDIVEEGDINRARLFLDKNILRIEGRELSKAG